MITKIETKTGRIELFQVKWCAAILCGITMAIKINNIESKIALTSLSLFLSLSLCLSFALAVSQRAMATAISLLFIF